jgi:hypothetical protein
MMAQTLKILTTYELFACISIANAGDLQRKSRLAGGWAFGRLAA